VQAPECWACGYCDSKMSLYMLGMTAALLATAAFIIMSSFTAMPVSTTHAVVGAVVGMSVVATSPQCLKLTPLAQIAASWLISPLLAGIIGSGMYSLLTKHVVMAPGVIRAASPLWPVVFLLH
jgi:solute carrier family 20 (sodium-dependent phosphate transporter)